VPVGVFSGPDFEKGRFTQIIELETISQEAAKRIDTYGELLPGEWSSTGADFYGVGRSEDAAVNFYSLPATENQRDTQRAGGAISDDNLVRRFVMPWGLRLS
jgi:hypothetical protein